MAMRFLIVIAAALVLGACASADRSRMVMPNGMTAVETAPAQGKIGPIYWFLGDR